MQSVETTTTTTTTTRKKASESLMNVFDSSYDYGARSSNSRVSDASSVETTRSSVLNLAVGGEEADGGALGSDPFSRMSKQEFLESIFGPALNLSDAGLTWQQKIRKFLTSNYFHIIVIVLVLLDSFCVTVELVVDMEASKENHAVAVVEKTFKYLGLTILSVFVVEITLKFLFNRHEFLHSKLELFDAVIVLVSFIVDLVFLNNKNAVTALGEIFALFRFWRIIRIVNGIIMTVEKRAEAKMDQMKQGLNALIAETQNLKLEIDKKQKLIDEIKVAYGI